MERVLDRIAQAGVAMGVVALLGLMAHVTADVVARYALGAPFVGTLEMVSSYWMLGCVFLPLAAVQRDRQQILVEVFTQRLAPARLARVEAVACLTTAAFVGLLAWTGAVEAWEQTLTGETTSSTSARFAIWPTRWFPVFGYAGTCAWLLVQAVRAWQGEVTHAAEAD